jgi:hypothetical protein
MLSRQIARFPTTVASALYLIIGALAFWPLWTGRVLLSNDQLTGYAFRAFAADYEHRFGGVAAWYPHLFGGMPYLANTQHGDTFFPTALLRFALPVDVGMAMGFFIFTVLAGIFTFIFLRGLGLSWAAAFVGGGAYMMSGQVVSMASPGHDGKLFVSALIPLALYFLYRATALRDWRQYVYFGVTVGFSLLTPHFQMTYYLLMAAGFFWLFMVFFSDQKAGAQPWWLSALLFGGALGVGFAIAAIQLVPFLDYLPWSPRGVAGSSSTGWAYATSWSMPPEEILNTVWPAFSGMLGDYWGRNSFKLHSEYSGAAVVLLSLLAFRLPAHRRMAWFFVFLAIYGAIFAFGGHTPFYRIPYTILPMIKSTRAVGMIYTLTTFSIAVLAAFGTHWLAARVAVVTRSRAKQGESISDRAIFGLPRPLAFGVGALGIFALLAAAGAWRPVMEAMAGASSSVNSRGCAQQPDLCIEANYLSFIADAFRALLFGLAVAALALPSIRRRLTTEGWAMALAAVVLLDLYSVERRYLSAAFSDRASVTLAPDGVVRTLKADTSVYRVFVLHADYMQNYLMVHGIRSTLGYNGSEIHRYDELLGGKNEWANALNPAMWPNLFTLLGVKYVILDQQVQFPTLEPVGGPMTTYMGKPAYVYRARQPNPYAFVVGDALRVRQPDDAIIPTILDPRFDPRRLLILPGDATAGRDSVAQLPATVDIPVTVREPRPGRLELQLERPPTDSAYVFISQNYFPDWHATVDGRPAQLVRAQVSLTAVRIPPGARTISMEMHSTSYATGRTITLVTILGVIILVAVTAVRDRRRRRSLPVPVGSPAPG